MFAVYRAPASLSRFIGLGFVLLATYLLASSAISQTTTAPPAPGPPGSSALRGREVRLPSFQGKPVLLDFWATWCAPCNEYPPGLVIQFNEKGLRSALASLASVYPQP